MIAVTFNIHKVLVLPEQSVLLHMLSPEVR